MSFDGLTGRVITPSDEKYPILRLEYNLAINRFPLAIVYCYTPTDVSNAILWQRWLRTAGRRISCFAGFNKKGIYLNGFFYGTKLEAERTLKDFLLLPGLLDESSIEYVPFIDAVRAIGAFYPLLIDLRLLEGLFIVLCLKQTSED